jgi:hypothetical protein
MSDDPLAALEMLDAFGSVGAQSVDITFTDAAGSKIGFRGNRPLGALRHVIAETLHDAAAKMHNVIVRPRSNAAVLIQLDDLGDDAAERLSTVSFLILNQPR